MDLVNLSPGPSRFLSWCTIGRIHWQNESQIAGPLQSTLLFLSIFLMHQSVWFSFFAKWKHQFIFNSFGSRLEKRIGQLSTILHSFCRCTSSWSKGHLISSDSHFQFNLMLVRILETLLVINCNRLFKKPVPCSQST